MSTFRRIGLWFGSALLAVLLFSVLFGLSNGQMGAFPFVFRITLMFALPVAFLYLPFVVSLRDAEERRIWTILVSSILIGPASLVFWGLLLQVKGGSAHQLWVGDGLDLGVVPLLPFASAVGFLTAAPYVIALKVIHWRLQSRIPSRASASPTSL